MTAAYVQAGAGALTATSGAQLALVQPATVNAGDLLIAHLFYGGSTTAPSAPGAYTLLSGPHDLTTPATNGRVWIYGKVADGTEDGVSTNWGNPAVTTPRRGRIYRFDGVRADTVANVVGGFNFEASNIATYTDVGVTTPENRCLAVNLVAQPENLPASISFTGETGGDWTEAVAEYTSTTGTPDTLLQLQTAAMPTTGTVNGGSQASGTALVRGIVGFYIRSMVSSILVTDDYNRADSGTVGNDSNANAWVERAGAWSISSNRVIQTDAGTVPGALLCGTDMARTTQWVEGVIGTGDDGTDQIGLLVRLNATAFTALSFEVADGAYKLIEVSAGSPTTVFTGTSHTHAAGETFACDIGPDNVARFYLNGSLVGSTTNAFNTADTRVGLHLNADVGNNTASWTNFRAGTGPYPGPAAGSTDALPEAATASAAVALDATVFALWPVLLIMPPRRAP